MSPFGLCPLASLAVFFTPQGRLLFRLLSSLGPPFPISGPVGGYGEDGAGGEAGTLYFLRMEVWVEDVGDGVFSRKIEDFPPGVCEDYDPSCPFVADGREEA